MSASGVLSAPSFASLSFDEKLDRLAEVAVRVGLGLRAGQELVLTAPTDALPLVRRITDHAYRAGALLVTTFLSDDACVLSRFEQAPDASFDYAPVWLQDAIALAFKSGAARMAIAGTNPALLGGQDPAKVAGDLEGDVTLRIALAPIPVFEAGLDGLLRGVRLAVVFPAESRIAGVGPVDEEPAPLPHDPRLSDIAASFDFDHAIVLTKGWSNTRFSPFVIAVNEPPMPAMGTHSSLGLRAPECFSSTRF